MCQELYRALNLCRHSCSCNPENFNLVVCEATFGYIVRGEGSSCWHLTCGDQGHSQTSSKASRDPPPSVNAC